MCTKKDPPDCIVKDPSGNDVGVEVSELVDKRAIEKVERGINTTRLWRENEVIQEIEKILKEKDLKRYHGSYSKIVVIIHTDEVSIEYEHIKPTIENHLFPPLKQIDEAYLLFSYPYKEKCPYIRLRLR